MSLEVVVCAVFSQELGCILQVGGSAPGIELRPVSCPSNQVA